MSNRQVQAEKTHRRETRLQIILPFVAGVVLVLVGGIIALLLPKRLQVSLIADLMLTVLVLCPAALCLFAVAIGFVAAAAGAGKLHGSLGSALSRVEGLSARVLEQSGRVTDVINRQTIGLSARFAFLDKLLGVFDRPASSSTKDETS